MTEAATIRVRLALFAALAAFTAAHWVALVKDPPVGRTVVAVLCAVAGAAALALIASRVRDRLRAWPMAAIAAVGIFAAVALALGLPARLLVPSGWGELLGDIGDGLGSLGNADYPYAGATPGRGWCCWRPSARCWRWPRRLSSGPVARRAGGGSALPWWSWSPPTGSR